MKEGWTYKPFEECLEKLPRTTKVPSSEYKYSGKFPIVSQEEGLISGYWDCLEDVLKLPHPIVVFGDHTRIVKYVDFDFVIGADGVKVLSPKNFLSAKFLYYYLWWCKIPSLGYSRHYKLLKELSIPVPPLSEQERIVSELDLLTEVIDKQKAQLKELDTLAQSIFYDMFGDPVLNDKGWESCFFKEIFKLKSGDGLTEKDFDFGQYPVYGGNGISGYHSKFNKRGKHIIIGRVGAYCGNVRFINGDFWLTDNAFDATFDTTKYSYYFVPFLLTAIDLHKFANHAAQPVISNVGLKDIILPLPPLSLQQSFADKVAAIEQQKAAIGRSIAETQQLFDYTMDKYFG